MDTTELHESSHITWFCIPVLQFDENLRFSTKQSLSSGRIFVFLTGVFTFLTEA